MFAAVTVSVFVFLLRPVDADATFNDLPGLYDVVRNGLPFCGKVLRVQSSGNTISGMKFDGVDQCTSAGITLERKHATGSSRDGASLCTYLMSSIFNCQPANSVILALFNPTKTVNSAVPGFADPYRFRTGIKYIMLSDNTNKGACIYKQRGASPSRTGNSSGRGGGECSASVQSPDDGSNEGGAGGGNSGGGGGGGGVPNPDFDSDAKDKIRGDGGGDSSIWVWLSPVLGAVATIAAAFIGVYCVRKGKQQDESGDASQAGATGIRAAVKINVGGQNDHSQNLPQPNS